MCSICKCSTRRKTLFEVFSSLTFEIYSRNAYKGICSILKCSTCRKMLFGSVFLINFWNLLWKCKLRHMQHLQMFNMSKNAFWQCFHHQLSKYTVEKQIIAYAIVTNVKYAGKRYLAVFSMSNLEIYSWTQMKTYTVFANVQLPKTSSYLAAFSKSY